MTSDDSLLVLRGPDIRELLANKKSDVIAAVRAAYCDHNEGRSFLPHSVFVRFPGREKERIIGLPGYLGGKEETAGMKWISSFPGNTSRGMSRASAILVLNSLETGRPEAILESSLISAARTAASAALAMDVLHAPGSIDVLGVVGCGLINREIMRFVSSVRPKIGQILLYDIDRARAEKYRDTLADDLGDVSTRMCDSVDQVMTRASVVSFATTAVKPSVESISMCRPGATILHISLRDLLPQAILQADNVVDDIDHVLRAETSVHLAEQQVGNRDFIRCTLADIMLGSQPARRDASSIAVFSPFGLGVLDLAVGKLVLRQAQAEGRGTRVDGFFAGT